MTQVPESGAISNTTDPYLNAAVEDYLLDQPLQAPALFVYVNRPCVVMGKNQNPHLECNVEALTDMGLPLVRRISGGGTVYHDGGNLNYAFIVPKKQYQRTQVFESIIHFLEGLGLNAALLDHSSIGIEGKKISGNAFCFRRENALHHGTLLVQTDLSKLKKVLHVNPPNLITHAVRSNPAPVVNIMDVNVMLNMGVVQRQLWEYFKGKTLQPLDVDHKDVLARAERLQSENWVWGKTPKFRTS